MLDALRDVSAPCMLYLFGVWLCRIVLVFLFLLYLIIVILVLNFAPIVHPQYTRVGYFFLNKIFSLPIKKEKNIILFCIARWRVTCGHLYLLSLEFLESCQRGSGFFFFLINKFYFPKKKKKSYAKGKI